jgi:asparagine synthase (glutamine-hydrolysing)
MCSVAGFYRIEDREADPRFLSAALRDMRHRGPDFERIDAIDSNVTLAHQRLAIIDVGAEGNQPMHLGGYSLAYNGEIYNYLELKAYLADRGITCETSSDTEVLLKGLVHEGVTFLHKCNGMFAFAFYDRQRRELILARDRYGVKPLHYMMQNGVLYFASEIRPLINIKQNLARNYTIYDSFIKDNATDYDENTFIEGIFQVGRGSLVRVGQGGYTSRAWYGWSDFRFDDSVFRSKENTIDFAESLLADAIDKRLRSDVPVCITLSGGLDSTTIYTLVKEVLRKDLAPFTYSHPGASSNELEMVERLVAQYDDVPVRVVSDPEAGLSELKDVLRSLEFPNWSLSAIAYNDMYRHVRESGYTVVLEGHAADELLGGYPYLIQAALFESVLRGDVAFAAVLFRVWSETNNAVLGQKSSLLRCTAAFLRNLAKAPPRERDFEAMLRYSFEYKVLPVLLRAFDRLTMAHSVESRSPFLDYRVVELLRSLPMAQKVSAIGSKALLREILKRHRKDFLYRRKTKMGFAADIPAFFRFERNREFMRRAVESYDVPRYRSLSKRALTALQQADIGWRDAATIWKAAALSLSDDQYGL